MKLLVKKTHPKAMTPTRAHDTDGGLDFYAVEDTIISVNDTATVPTGIAIGLPEGTVGKVYSRSSQGLRRVSLANRVGIIDQGYTGEIMATIENLGDSPYTIRAGQKICQIVIVPVLKPDIEVVDSLPETTRGTQGHGSTGIS